MEAELPRVKVKVGRDPAADPARLSLCREAIGDGVELMVDANGAFAAKEALAPRGRILRLRRRPGSRSRSAPRIAPGLRLVREQGVPGMAVAAGEYEWDLPRLPELAPCVDTVQADVTRIGGITNLLRVDGICKGLQRPFSAHCAPAISAHACCAIETLAHLEYFHDHVRVERLLFDGTLDPHGGTLEPDRSRPGHGLELKRAEVERWAA